eukprot:6202143-Pleurochrysis_carterae.AAC.2
MGFVPLRSAKTTGVVALELPNPMKDNRRGETKPTMVMVQSLPDGNAASGRGYYYGRAPYE